MEVQRLGYLWSLVRTLHVDFLKVEWVIGVSIYSQGTSDSEASQSPSPLPSKKTTRVMSKGRRAGSALTGMA